AERFLGLYPLIAKSGAMQAETEAELFERLDKVLGDSVRTETDRSLKGRPAWHKARKLASAQTAEANWQQMRERALRDCP
ncbi:MAG TPA: hypothetical protein VGE01_03725, partial [Fimbriimonas sp.]